MRCVFGQCFVDLIEGQLVSSVLISVNWMVLIGNLDILPFFPKVRSD